MMVDSGSDLPTMESCRSLSTRSSRATATPMTLSSVFKTSAHRFFTTPEIIDLISPATSPLSLSSPPGAPPPSGSVFLYDRSVARRYKHDGHDWVKKLVSSKTSTYRVREDSVRLRHGTRYRLAAYYARSAAGGGMRRRCYSLIDPDSLKPLSNYVLVHYLDIDQIPPSGDMQAGSSSKPEEARNISIGQGRDALMSSPSDAQTKNNLASHRKKLEAYPHTVTAISVDKPVQEIGLVEPVRSVSIYNAETRRDSDIGGSSDDKSFDNVRAYPRQIGTFNERNDGHNKSLDASALHAPTSLKEPSPQHRAIASLAQFAVAPKITPEGMTKEWSSSTDTERSAAIADIYGNAVTIANSTGGSLTHAESNKFANELQREIEEGKLSQMENEIDSVPPKSKLCYLEALKHSPHLVLPRDVKLQFLRCEDFCPRAAAHRLVNYWNERVAIFGPEGAFLPLTLEGTMAHDYEDPGFHHVRLLPGTDASGRAIIFFDNTIPYTRETGLRALWYMAHAALEDDAAKRNGCICIVNRCSPPEVLDRQSKIELQQSITNVLPLRLRACHVCHLKMNGVSGWIASAVSAVLNFAAGKYVRSRVVFHDGSIEEVLVQLAEYGISMNQLPTSIGGVVTDEEFVRWLALRRAAGR